MDNDIVDNNRVLLLLFMDNSKISIPLSLLTTVGIPKQTMVMDNPLAALSDTQTIKPLMGEQTILPSRAAWMASLTRAPSASPVRMMLVG